MSYSAIEILDEEIAVVLDNKSICPVTRYNKIYKLRKKQREIDKFNAILKANLNVNSHNIRELWLEWDKKPRPKLRTSKIEKQSFMDKLQKIVDECYEKKDWQRLEKIRKAFKL